MSIEGNFDWDRPLVDNNGKDIVSFRPATQDGRVVYAERADGTTVSVFKKTGCSMYDVGSSKSQYHTSRFVTYKEDTTIKEMTDAELAKAAREADAAYGKLHHELEARGYIIENEDGEEQSFYHLGRIYKEVDL